MSPTIWCQCPPDQCFGGKNVSCRKKAHAAATRASDAAKVSRALQDVAKQLDGRLEQLLGHRVSFSLFVWTQGRSNYISTAPRAEVMAVLEEHLKGWKAGMPDVPAHEVT